MLLIFPGQSLEDLPSEVARSIRRKSRRACPTTIGEGSPPRNPSSSVWIERTSGKKDKSDFIVLGKDGVHWVVEGQSDRRMRSTTMGSGTSAQPKSGPRFVRDEVKSGTWRYTFVTETHLGPYQSHPRTSNLSGGAIPGATRGAHQRRQANAAAAATTTAGAASNQAEYEEAQQAAADKRSWADIAIQVGHILQEIIGVKHARRGITSPVSTSVASTRSPNRTSSIGRRWPSAISTNVPGAKLLHPATLDSRCSAASAARKFAIALSRRVA